MATGRKPPGEFMDDMDEFMGVSMKMDDLYMFIMEHPIKMDDLGVSLFMEPPNGD